MDPTATNYDSRATVNSGSWCIPRVTGCMMPTETNANAAYSNPEAVSTAPHMNGRQPDGLNANYSLFATQHDPSACVIARYGCGASGAPITKPGFAAPVAALNYDPAVTVETICYWPRAGCLNPAARNFGCDNSDATAPCYHAQNVTVHSPAACSYHSDDYPSPPTPPMPAFPPGYDLESDDVTVSYEVKVEFVVDADIAFFTENVRKNAISAFKIAINETEKNVTLDVYLASVILAFKFASEDKATADAFEQSVSSGIGSTAASAQATLGNAIGVQVLRGADIIRRTVVTFKPLGMSAGAVAGIVIGSTCLFLSCLCVAWRECVATPRRRRSDSQKRYLRTVVGAPARVHPDD